MGYKLDNLPTRLKLTVLDYVLILDEVVDGVVKIEPFTRGQIVRVEGQSSADVWFPYIGHYHNDPVREALALKGTYTEHLQGLVMHLSRSKFAVEYDFDRHENIHIPEEKALTIPYFTPNEKAKIPTQYYQGKERVYEYQLGYIKDVCDEAFENFVQNQLEFTKITKQDREVRSYPEWADRRLTDESEKIYEAERQALELAFARATGVYYDFLGGLFFLVGRYVSK